LSVGVAETLGRDYLNAVARESTVHTLMDLFDNEKAKRALHNPELEMQQICLNF